jgi:hypothetical protein
MAAAPFGPAGGVAGWLGAVEGDGEQSPDLADGERDEARVGRRRGVRPRGRWRLGVSPVPELGGGDRADRQGGHDQHGVPEDRGVEPGLALVQAEAALSGLEAFLYWPPQPGCPDQPGLATSDFTGFLMSSAGIHCRAPARAWPVFSRT